MIRAARAALVALLTSAAVAFALDFGEVTSQTAVFGEVASQDFSLPPAEGGAWTPADATGLVAWWDLTSTDHLTVSGADVTGATDRSGNGHHLDVVSATEPTFNATRFGDSLGGVDFAAASSTFLARNSAPVTAAPFQIYCVVRPVANTAAMTAVWLGDKDSAGDYWAADLSGATGGDPFRWFSVDSSTAVAVTSTGFSTNTVHLLWGLETSNVSRAARIDGGSEGTNTTDLSPDGSDRIGLGGRLDSSPDAYFDGAIAEVVLLNTASTADRAAFHTYFETKYGLTLP